MVIDSMIVSWKNCSRKKKRILCCVNSCRFLWTESRWNRASWLQPEAMQRKATHLKLSQSCSFVFRWRCQYKIEIAKWVIIASFVMYRSRSNWTVSCVLSLSIAHVQKKKRNCATTFQKLSHERRVCAMRCVSNVGLWVWVCARASTVAPMCDYIITNNWHYQFHLQMHAHTRLVRSPVASHPIFALFHSSSRVLSA